MIGGLAATGVSFAISPTRLVFTTAPGQTVAALVTVYNQSDVPGHLESGMKDTVTLAPLTYRGSLRRPVVPARPGPGPSDRGARATLALSRSALVLAFHSPEGRIRTHLVDRIRTHPVEVPGPNPGQ